MTREELIERINAICLRTKFGPTMAASVIDTVLAAVVAEVRKLENTGRPIGRNRTVPEILAALAEYGDEK